MSVTRIENVFRTRDLLDNPLPQRPSAHQMMRQEISEEMDIVNALNNTGKPWGINTYQLNYTPLQNEYTINVTDWGKVYYVTRLTGNQYIPAVNVPFDDLNDQEYGYLWANWATGLYGTIPWFNNTPEKMSFSRSGVLNSTIQVTINPRPAQSWTYEITYIPGYIGTDDPLAAAIQLPEHAELVRLRAAAALLPYTEWGDDPAYNKNRREELMAAFNYQLHIKGNGGKEKLFANYITSLTIPKTVDVDYWN